MTYSTDVVEYKHNTNKNKHSAVTRNTQIYVRTNSIIRI